MVKSKRDSSFHSRTGGNGVSTRTVTRGSAGKNAICTEDVGDIINEDGDVTTSSQELMTQAITSLTSTEQENFEKQILQKRINTVSFWGVHWVIFELPALYLSSPPKESTWLVSKEQLGVSLCLVIIFSDLHWSAVRLCSLFHVLDIIMANLCILMHASLLVGYTLKSRVIFVGWVCAGFLCYLISWQVRHPVSAMWCHMTMRWCVLWGVFYVHWIGIATSDYPEFIANLILSPAMTDSGRFVIGANGRPELTITTTTQFVVFMIFNVCIWGSQIILWQWVNGTTSLSIDHGGKLNYSSRSTSNGTSTYNSMGISTRGDLPSTSEKYHQPTTDGIFKISKKDCYPDDGKKAHDAFFRAYQNKINNQSHTIFKGRQGYNIKSSLDKANANLNDPINLQQRNLQNGNVVGENLIFDDEDQHGIMYSKMSNETLHYRSGGRSDVNKKDVNRDTSRQ